jgi:predicted MPP superfamily phosphohydrolase
MKFHLTLKNNFTQMKYGFFIIMLAIFLALFAYVLARGCQALPAQGYWRQLYAGISILAFLSFFTALFAGQKMPLGLASAMSFVGNTYFIVFLYLAFLFAIGDTVRLANHFIHFAPAGMATFRFWWFAASLAVIAVALVAGHYRFNHPEVVRLSIESAKPLQHKELKIVAVSDLHTGFSIRRERLKRYVDLINAQQPDIVLIAGDFTDRSIAPVIRQNMREEIMRIKAPLGVYAINGNHELYAEQPGATAAYLRAAGVTVLVDSSVLVGGSFYIVGRDDCSNPARKPLPALMQGLDGRLPVILLDHQPNHLAEAMQQHVDLQISGHTHDGQFFPVNLIEKRIFEQPHGYLRKGDTHYYVSSGLGIWGPQYRIGTQSELVVIDMKY